MSFVYLVRGTQPKKSPPSPVVPAPLKLATARPKMMQRSSPAHKARVSPIMSPQEKKGFLIILCWFCDVCSSPSMLGHLRILPLDKAGVQWQRWVVAEMVQG